MHVVGKNHRYTFVVIPIRKGVTYKSNYGKERSIKNLKDLYQYKEVEWYRLEGPIVDETLGVSTSRTRAIRLECGVLI